jgi:hypothetical protein
MMSFHRLDAKELELIYELARKGPQQLIELAAFAAVAADRHERSQERVNVRSSPRLLRRSSAAPE